MLKLSLDNKVGTKMVKEVVDILTQEAEISLRLEGTMFRVIKTTGKMSIKTTMLHWRTRILLPKNIVQIMLKIMVSLLVKFLGNQITLLLIVGICRFDYSYQSEDLSQALVAFAINDQNDRSFYVDSWATSHMTNDTSKLSSIKSYDESDVIYVRDRYLS